MNNNTPCKFQIFSREWIRFFAMLFMICDHAYMTVIATPGFTWLTSIGRIAFPLFAFQIVEGFLHTSSRKKYISTMLLFALLSEIPFNLMMGGEWFDPFDQNVLFTFLIALLLLCWIDKIRAHGFRAPVRILFYSLICLLGFLIGTLCFVDYSGFGVLTVLLFYFSKQMPKKYLEMGFQFISLWVINWFFLGGKIIEVAGGLEFPEQGLALLSLIFIWLYNGKKSLSGKAATVFQYFCYFFYPVHILLLSLFALHIL